VGNFRYYESRSIYPFPRYENIDIEDKNLESNIPIYFVLLDQFFSRHRVSVGREGRGLRRGMGRKATVEGYDGYQWRKNGSKTTKNGVERKYFKCARANTEGCPASKIVWVEDGKPCVETRWAHNHEPRLFKLPEDLSACRQNYKSFFEGVPSRGDHGVVHGDFLLEITKFLEGLIKKKETQLRVLKDTKKMAYSCRYDLALDPDLQDLVWAMAEANQQANRLFDRVDELIRKFPKKPKGTNAQLELGLTVMPQLSRIQAGLRNRTTVNVGDGPPAGLLNPTTENGGDGPPAELPNPTTEHVQLASMPPLPR
jgi:hypothetical protein